MSQVLFLIANLGGSFIQAVSGFGFGIFVMTIYPSIFPVGSCATLSGLLSMTPSVYLSIKMRKHGSFRRILFPILGFFLFSLPAILLSTVSPNDLLQKILAVCLILLSAYFLFFEHKVHLKESRLNGFIAGALGGILGGFFSMGGPPIVAYLLQSAKKPEQYLAEIQTYFAVTNTFTAAVRLLNGMITAEILKYWAIGLLATLLGTLLGKFVSRYINGTLLKRIVYCFMALSGILLLR